MVAIAAHKGPQILFVPIGEDQMKIPGCFFPFPAVVDFIHHQKAHAVGQGQQFRSWGIVGHTNGVAAHFGQQLKLTFGCPSVEGGTQGARVVVLVHPLNKNSLTIYFQTFLAIKVKGSDAEVGGVTIQRFSVLFEGGQCPIPMGRLGGWRSPQQGGFHKGFCFNGCFAVCLNEHVHFGSKGQSRSLRLPVAPQIKDFGLQFYRSSLVEVVGYSCFYLYRCLCLCDFWRGDVSPPLGYVHRFGLVEPNIAVKSPSRIPARAVRRIRSEERRVGRECGGGGSGRRCELGSRCEWCSGWDNEMS